MLKRNGEFCRHEVPNYAGHLTDSEFNAYSAALPQTEKYVSELIVAGNRTSELEKSLSRRADSGINEPGKYGLTSDDGRQWQVIDSLFKVAGGEFLFCKRDANGKNHFAVIEKMDMPTNQHGAGVHSEGEDVQQLLQKFVKNVRETLRLWANDVEIQAREKLETEYSGQDMSRVAKAISQHCAAVISGETPAAQIQAQNHGRKISV